MPDDWQKQLMRSTSDLAALCGRRVGKSQSAGWVAAHHVVEGEGRTALCISPTQRQSGELFRLAKAAIVKAMPDASFPTDNRLSIELPNGSRLLSLPGDPGTVRGLTASLVLLDETQSLPDGGHELFASVRPMLATTGGRMIVLGTPLDRSGPAVRHLGRRHRAGLDARARAEHAVPAHPERHSWRASAGCWARRLSGASILPSSPRRRRACSTTICCRPRCCPTISCSIRATCRAGVHTAAWPKSGSAACGRA